MSAAWWAVLGAGIGTFAMRASFLAFAHRLADVPPAVQRVLRQIPPAALASLVIPALLRPDGHLDLWNDRFVAGVVAALVAWRTRNIALTLVVGMGLVMLIDLLDARADPARRQPARRRRFVGRVVSPWSSVVKATRHVPSASDSGSIGMVVPGSRSWPGPRTGPGTG